MSNTDKKGQTFNHDTIEAMNETKDIKNNPSKYNSFNDVLIGIPLYAGPKSTSKSSPYVSWIALA